MTHLEAELKDFELVKDAEGKDRYYRFRFGRCEDFVDAMETFKATIWYGERRPQPDQAWLWEVDATPENRQALSKLFDNFEASWEAARSQLRMFE